MSGWHALGGRGGGWIQPCRRRSDRRGHTLAEVLVATGLVALGIVPLLGHWAGLASQTRGLLTRADALREVRAAMTRYESMGPEILESVAGQGGWLPPSHAVRPVTEARVERAGGLVRLTVVSRRVPAVRLVRLIQPVEESGGPPWR